VTRIAVTTTFIEVSSELNAALAGDELIDVQAGDFERAAGAEVAISGNDPKRARALLAAVPTLRWYHTISAGVDRLMIPEVVEHPLVLTNNSGAYDIPIAEHVLATIYAAAKGLPERFRAQERHHWDRDADNRELRDATVVILGMGSIGGEVARLATGAGMHVIGIRRSAQPGAATPDQLADVAAQADYLAVCAPLTTETKGMVNADVIARLPPHAWVINIARGEIIDEPALLAACRERRIGGAAIDAWWQEPLPAESEWWTLPNVIVTPHLSNESPRLRSRTVALILENVRRYKAGEPLLNVVDKKLGY
jgi:phosphoglycerate dehydrogenase-like enzyme